MMIMKSYKNKKKNYIFIDISENLLLSMFFF